MSNFPSIHDAYGGFGQKNQTSQIKLTQKIQKSELPSQAVIDQANERQKNLLPTDASHSDYPIKICCPKCRNIGTAAWVWCVLLAPFGGSGFICLCLDSCRDQIHYCTRCGNIVGKKNAKVC